MYYNNDIEIFLRELKKFMKDRAGRKESSISIYLGKIRKILGSGYSVSDLCGGVDKLIEDYSPAGNKFNEHDHGKTKAALKQVRNMIKGDIISSLYISYKKGSSVWNLEDKHITEYNIKDEKIIFSFNTSAKKYVRKIGPVNIGKLIYILREAERQGFLCNQHFEQFPKTALPIDAPSLDKYEYHIGNSSGICFGKLLIDSNSPNRKDLQKQYDDLINQLVNS